GRCSFFFFQAEDGIRDDLVTGVQTCALPIFSLPRLRYRLAFQAEHHATEWREFDFIGTTHVDDADIRLRPLPLLTGRVITANDEIGRASCRERGETSGGGGA